MIAERLPTSQKVRKLQRSLYLASKGDPRRRFYSLYDKICRKEILQEAFKRAKGNGGASGVDHLTWEDINEEQLIIEIHTELSNGTYRPSPVRRVYIPKSSGKRRPLGISTIKDRVVQTAVKIVVEPIFEAHFYEHSYGFRPQRNTHQMLERAGRLLNAGYCQAIELDLQQYFDSVNHSKLLKMVARRISDGKVIGIIRHCLKTSVNDNGRLLRNDKGCPQGGPLSPLLANIYLSVLDFSFLKYTRYKDCVLLRYADDNLILCKPHALERAWTLAEKVMGNLDLTINRDKTRIIDMSRTGASINVLGYTLYRNGSKMMYLPQKKALSALKVKLRGIIGRNNSAKITEIVTKADQVISGWVRYFALCQYRYPFVALSKFVFLRMRKLLLRRSKYRGWRRRKYSFKWIQRALGFDGPYVAWLKARSLI